MGCRKHFLLVLLFCIIVPTIQAQNISGVVNSYFKVLAFIPSHQGVKVQNVSGLTTHDRVLIIQMKGAAIDETNAASFGNISSVNGAGLYEFATVCSLLNDTVVFENQLLNTYDYTKSVQLVRVPKYTNVTVTGELQAQPWSASTETGGVVAIEVSGTLTLNANINANGAGYTGGSLLTFPNCTFLTTSSAYYYSPASVVNSNANGTYKGEGINSTIATKEGGKGKQSNGGGSGNNHNTGGGGGSNYGAAGNGGNYVGGGSFPCNGTQVGIGGLSLSSYGYSGANNRIFAGGGGGAGHQNNGEGTPGGNGGGIVIIQCAELVGNGYTISANGAQGSNSSNPVPTESNGDGGGGGGGGGTVLLHVTTYTGTLTVEAKGADGNKAGFQAQCPGPGGGGGGGVIWTNSSLSGGVTTSVAGGAAGIIKDSPNNPACELTSNGATAGASGAVLSGFAIPEGTVYNCSPVLASGYISDWKGRLSNETVLLEWQLNQVQSVQEVWLERKSEKGPFKTIKVIDQPKSGYYSFDDIVTQFPNSYRLMVYTSTGKKEYSNVLYFSRPKQYRLQLFPNPVLNQVVIQLPAGKSGKATVYVTDVTGKQQLQQQYIISNTQSRIVCNLSSLRAGIYFLKVYCNNEFYTEQFVKQ